MRREPAQVNEQVDRMTAIVEHQLRRAATSGGVSVGPASVDVLPIAQDLRGALLKVHAQKDFSLELAVPAEVQFVGDRDDLIEALGNLMDNAAKWCRSRVRVTARLQAGVGAGQKLRVVVEDDGPGIARGGPCAGTAARRARRRGHARGTVWAWPWCATWPRLYGGSAGAR